MTRRTVLGALLALIALVALDAGAPAQEHGQGLPRVRLETELGVIVIEADVKRAPISAGNFLAYVDRKRFDGTTFYRAARIKGRPGLGLVQGGINHAMRGALPPIPHEPTSKTGLRHVDGTVSMARNEPGTAMGDFFITVGAAPYLDAASGKPGYAAFGRVVEGMPVARKILTGATYPGGRSATTKGQTLVKPVRIISARRVR